MSKTIGILGGMGPEATGHMFNLIVGMTNAETDQEHIPMVIVNNPHTPDRTAHLLNDGPSPLPILIDGARKLENADVDFIIMPCHTAHFFFREISEAISTPLLHLQRETLRFIEETLPGLKRLGLIATTGTIETGLFQKIFSEKDLEIITPEPLYQEKVMTAIYDIKKVTADNRQEPLKLLREVTTHLHSEGAEAIIAGCTEISMVLDKEPMNLPFADPLKIIARVSILEAGYKVRE